MIKTSSAAYTGYSQCSFLFGTRPHALCCKCCSLDVKLLVEWGRDVTVEVLGCIKRLNLTFDLRRAESFDFVVVVV